MEAPKLKQLLKVAEKRNPNWYPFVYGYLNGELPNLELDNSDIEVNDIDEQPLFMGNYDSCVVGEQFGFSSRYEHGKWQNCILCGRYASELCLYSGASGRVANDIMRANFAQTLRNFYKHMGYMK